MPDSVYPLLTQRASAPPATTTTITTTAAAAAATAMTALAGAVADVTPGFLPTRAITACLLQQARVAASSFDLRP